VIVFFGTEGKSRFYLVCRGARSVSLLGEFNNWSITATRLRRVGLDLWETWIDLPGGLHPHAFCVEREKSGPRRVAPPLIEWVISPAMAVEMMEDAACGSQLKYPP
jgi:hypothetical protein